MPLQPRHDYAGTVAFSAAARTLNAGGDPPEWLKNVIALTDGVVHRIDQVVQDLIDSPRGRA